MQEEGTRSGKKRGANGKKFFLLFLFLFLGRQIILDCKWLALLNTRNIII